MIDPAVQIDKNQLVRLTSCRLHPLNLKKTKRAAAKLTDSIAVPDAYSQLIDQIQSGNANDISGNDLQCD